MLTTHHVLGRPLVALPVPLAVALAMPMVVVIVIIVPLAMGLPVVRALRMHLAPVVLAVLVRLHLLAVLLMCYRIHNLALRLLFMCRIQAT